LDQVLVDAPCDEMQVGAVEGSVVPDPAAPGRLCPMRGRTGPCHCDG
jgi:hypothetical protein